MEATRDDLVGAPEVAAALGVSRATAWKLMKEGHLPSFKLAPYRNARRHCKREHVDILRERGYEALQEHLNAENGNGHTGGGRS